MKSIESQIMKKKTHLFSKRPKFPVSPSDAPRVAFRVLYLDIIFLQTEGIADSIVYNSSMVEGVPGNINPSPRNHTYMSSN